MTQPVNLSYVASAANLRRLVIIRLILILGLLGALGYLATSGNDAVIRPTHWWVVSILMSSILLTFWRLFKPWPVTDAEYFFQLLIDLICLTILLYISGGATNPFVSFYLVPLTISAAILPWKYTWFIAGFSLLAYSGMLFYYLPLPLLQPTGHQHHQQGGDFNLHIAGMWFTFALSTGLITYFVVRMAHALRQQDRAQTESRENQLRDEQILAVATLAAGTAHELGTPLATMTVLMDEMEADYEQQDGLNDDIRMLKNQVANCKHILRDLVTTAEAHNHGQSTAVAMADYLRELISHWQVLRPEVSFNLSISSDIESQLINVEPTLKQAIINLLNNAADACPKNIDITLDLVDRKFMITIRDYGPGIPTKIADQMGKPFISTKGKGLGLGLFLSHATINRYGGNITLLNAAGGGTIAEILIPTSSEN